MTPRASSRLCLPTQARPIDRTGLRAAAVCAPGVEPDGILDWLSDAAAWIGDQISSGVEYVGEHPQMLLSLAPLLL